MRYLKVVLLLLAFVQSNNAYAAEEFIGRITNIMAEGGVIRVTLCAQDKKCKTFYVKPDSDFNRSVVSILLSGKATNSVMWMYGRGNQPLDWPYYGAIQLTSVDYR